MPSGFDVMKFMNYHDLMTSVKRPSRKSPKRHTSSALPAAAPSPRDTRSGTRLTRQADLAASPAANKGQPQFEEENSPFEATSSKPYPTYNQPPRATILHAHEPFASTAPLANSEREFDELLGKMVRILANTGRLNAAAVRAVADLAAAAGIPLGETGSYSAPLPVSKPSDPAHPLDSARERGRLAAIREWESPTNLPLKEAAALAGRSDRMLNLDRQAGRVYALVLPGRERGFRYPSWQLTVDGNRLAAALGPFVAAGASCWVIHSFMHRPQDALQDLTPAQWVADPARPIEAVVQMVQTRYRDEQGAG